MKNKSRNKKGFTLIELIVVIAVLGILVLLAAPKFLGHTKDARIAQIKADIKSYETVLASKLVHGDEFTKDWDSITKEEMESYRDSESLMNKKGKVDSEYIFNSEYLEIPEDLEGIKTNLKGDFIMNSGGEVYYYENGLKVEDNKGNSGNISEDNGSDKNEPEDVIAFNLKVKKVFSSSQDVSIMLTAENEVYAKSSTSDGRKLSGTNVSSPLNQWVKVNIPGDKKVKEIKTTWSNTYFITEDNILYGSGLDMGLIQVTPPFTYTNYIYEPIKISDLTVKEMGEAHVLFTNGDVYYYATSGDFSSGIPNCTSCNISFEKIMGDVTDIIYSSGRKRINLIQKNDGVYSADYRTQTDNVKYPERTVAGASGLGFHKVNDFNSFKLADVKNIASGGLNMATINYLLNDGKLYSDSYYETQKYFPSLNISANEREPKLALINIKEMYTNGLMDNKAFVIAVSNDGKVYMHGDNPGGLLNGDNSTKMEWTLLENLPGGKVAEFLVTNYEFGVYRTTENKFYGYGRSTALGFNSKTPVEINFNFE